MPDDIMLGVHQDKVAYDTVEKYGIQCSRWLRDAFRQVVKKQEEVAKYNQARRSERFRVVTFEVGQSVLYWRPPAEDRVEAQEEGDAPTSTPAKWRFRWDGPFRITAVRNDNHYEFIDTSGRPVIAHCNRLCLFDPWSDELPSTSAQMDEERPWKQSGQVKVGDLFVTPLEDCEGFPFGVGKVVAINQEDELDFVWLGNSTGNLRGSYVPGWYTEAGTVYYADTKRAKGDVPYRGEHSGTVVRQGDLVVWGFKLTERCRLPLAVLRMVSRSDRVDWELPPGLDQAGEDARD